MTNPELNAAIATCIMGWGEGAIVWGTGDSSNPTRQWFSPATDLADARKAARKEPAEICRVLLEGGENSYAR